ncbi:MULTISPECIES: acetylornithine/succinyldiaminopimelate transaminase [Thauera]|uniref:Acetylornithine aminotransferase n=1 Tax=Thauera aromatica K172 TaxID=44139 RepID=A0A2R4BMD8_THAAR|nr:MULTISPECIES: acetylornithine/succinyldiaminopimelate transaminase [Thauera]AVR88353.1 aspartate aminotransferase family protein [Thauera aromatica K172]KIN91725.1 succinylornithine transaminase/acetylornithine aminotransferase [Thauera sp. SWB20]NUQ49555.1 acetylornithine/succinyldiaminopimelate transaminase [Phycisphaerae bacterium]
MSHTESVGRTDFDRLMIPCYAPDGFIPVRGEGSRVWDQHGRELIDFAGGIAVNALGHAHPSLVRALVEQAGKLWHVSNLYTNEPALRLASKLVAATFAERVFFANSGAEANEAAFKLARRHGLETAGAHKHEIVAALDSFHGRTLFTVSVAGQPKYSAGFGPPIGGIRHVRFNDIGALEAAVSANTCAIVLEPVLGESGVLPAERAYLERARELCDEHGALLVFDEVQTGMGRVGELFAYQRYGVTPDVLTSAKALGGGFPIAAMLTRADLAGHLGVGSHGSTYGGNPLACAVAEAVLDIIATPAVLAGVRERHERFSTELRRIGAQTGLFEQVRGLGLLLGGVLGEAWKGRARDVMRTCEEEGLMVLQAGPDVIRLAPSLVIDAADIDEGMRRLERAARRLRDEAGRACDPDTVLITGVA